MPSASTEVCAVIGEPITHSLSPFIMNRAFAAAGIDAIYVAFQVGLSGVDDAMRGMAAMGIIGANVTFPLKEAVLLSASRRTHEVDVIGAANVVTFDDDGAVAANTDCDGTVSALTTFARMNVEGSHAMIFGAGGAARAAAYGLLDAGVDRVTLTTRNPDGYHKDMTRLHEAFPQQTSSLIGLDDSALPAALNDADIVINATPVGMADVETPQALIDGSMLHGDQVCFEFVYHPVETAFLRDASNAGATTIGGLTLLVAQAQATFALWTDEEFDLQDMFDATTQHLAAMTQAGRSDT